MGTGMTDILIFFFLLPYLALLLVSPLDGMARNYYYYFHLDGYARAHILCLDPFYSYLLIPEEKKIFGLSWNQNQVPLLHDHKQPL